jgi:hypothetical protein
LLYDVEWRPKYTSPVVGMVEITIRANGAAMRLTPLGGVPNKEHYRVRWPNQAMTGAVVPRAEGSLRRIRTVRHHLGACGLRATGLEQADDPSATHEIEPAVDSPAPPVAKRHANSNGRFPISQGRLPALLSMGANGCCGSMQSDGRPIATATLACCAPQSRLAARGQYLPDDADLLLIAAKTRRERLAAGKR